MIEPKAVNFLNECLGTRIKSLPKLQREVILTDEKTYDFYCYTNGAKHSFVLLSLKHIKVYEYHSHEINKDNDQLSNVISSFHDKCEAMEELHVASINKKYKSYQIAKSHPYLKKVPNLKRDMKVNEEDDLIIPVCKHKPDKIFDFYKVKQDLSKVNCPLGSWYLFGDIDVYDSNQYAYFCQDLSQAYSIYKKTSIPTFSFFYAENMVESAINIQNVFGTIKVIVIGKENIRAKRSFVNSILREEDDTSFVREDFTEISPLGVLNNSFYYYSSYSNSIFDISHTHSKDFMLSLAPYRFYKEKFKKKNKDEADLNKASSFFKELCLLKGNYDPTKIRQAGFFENEGNIYLWNGKVAYNKKDDNYIHAHSNDFKVNIYSPKRASYILKRYKELVDITSQFSWKNKKTSAETLIAWLCMSPFCGALKWRPHIYLTGRMSSGKSWVQENLISRFLKDKRFMAIGNSTEAGIRRLVCHNYIPLLFDEFEKTESRIRNMEYQNILIFLKLSSGNNDGDIVKSSPNHGLNPFSGKTMACLSSIFLFLKKPEDLNRFLIFTFSEQNMNLKAFSPIEKALREFPLESFSKEVISFIFHKFKEYDMHFNEEAMKFSEKIEQKVGRSNNHFSRSLAVLSAFTNIIGYKMEEDFRKRWIDDHLSLRNVSNPQKDCLNFFLSSIIEFERIKATLKSHITNLYCLKYDINGVKNEISRLKRSYKDNLGIFFKGEDLYISRGHRVLNDLFKSKPEYQDFAWYESLSNYVSSDETSSFKIKKSSKNVRFGSTVSYALIFENYGELLKNEEDVE